MIEPFPPEKIVVACGADENYSMAMGVTTYSVVKHLRPGSTIKFYIISGGISTASKARIKNVLQRKDVFVSIVFIEMRRDLLASLPCRGHLSSSACLRLFLPSLLPINCHKVLYLDSDLLVRTDIRPLWDIDISDYYLAAVADPGIPNVSSPGGVWNWSELGINADLHCFNSGVLLINLSAWRESDISAATLDYLRRNSDHLSFLDQDALNAVCFESWIELDMTWNLQPVQFKRSRNIPSQLQTYITDHFEELYNNPSICHFASKFKPWTHGYMMKFQHEWFKCLRQSGWFSLTEFLSWMYAWTVRHIAIAFIRKVLRHPLDNNG